LQSSSSKPLLAQTCRDRKKAIWPKAVLRGAANSCAGLRDQCPALEAMAFKGCVYHGPDQSSHPLKSYILNSFFD
jgi:hypothetical protein